MSGDEPFLPQLAQLTTTISELGVTQVIAAVAPLAAHGDALVVGEHPRVVTVALADVARAITVLAGSSAILESVPPSPRVATRVGTTDPIPFPDDSFDAVIAVDPAIDVAATSVFVAECLRVVRPTGVIALASTDDAVATAAEHALAAGAGSVRRAVQIDAACVALAPADRAPSSSVHRRLVVAADRPLPEIASAEAHEAEAVGTLLGIIDDLLAERAVQRRNTARLVAELVHLHEVQEQLIDAEQRVAAARSLELQLGDSQSRVEALLQEIEAIHRSGSWRMTEPVRRAGVTARHLAGDTLRRLRPH